MKSLFASKLLKNSFIYTISDGVNKAVPFFILPILSYYLLPSDYGIVSNFNVLLSIVALIIPLGTTSILGIKFYIQSKEEFSNYVSNILVIGFLTTFFLVLFATVLSDFLIRSFKIDYTILLITVLSGFFSLLTTIHLSVFRYTERAVNFGIYGISQTVINIVMSLLLIVIYSQGWIGRVAGVLIATITFGLYSLYSLYKSGYIRSYVSKPIIKECLIFGLPLLPHALSFWVRGSIDRLFITSLVSEHEAGLYATGFQFGLLVSFITLSFNNAFSPYIYKKLSESDESKLEGNKNQLVGITRYVAVGLVLLCFLFVLFSDYIITHLFSEKYFLAKKYVPLAILSQLFQGLYLLVVNYVFFVKKTQHLATITIFSALLQIPLSYFLIQFFGGIGGAYATVFVSFLTFVSVYILSQKVFPMNWFTK